MVAAAAAAAAFFGGKVCPRPRHRRNEGTTTSTRRIAAEVAFASNVSSSVEATTASVGGAAEKEDSVRWAHLALQGPRSEMEDEIQIENSRLPGFTCAAVFDGHAGFSTVSFLKNELLNECAEALQEGNLLESDNLASLEAALSQAFLQADERLLSWLDEAETDKDSGSTATVMFLGKDKAVVAHVGDSRAVMSRGGKAEVLTADHRPYGSTKAAVTEAQRIRAAGGWISDGRVCGNLAVSRAFGNICLKTRRQEMLQEGLSQGRWTQKFVSRLNLTGDWLVAKPDVTSTKLDPDTEFIILASDGLWDSFKSSEAVTFVRDQLREHGDTQRACEALASAALSRNGQDNVSIIIADLGKVTRQEGFTQQEEEVGRSFKKLLIASAFALLIYFMSSQFAGNILETKFAMN